MHTVQYFDLTVSDDPIREIQTKERMPDHLMFAPFLYKGEFYEPVSSMGRWFGDGSMMFIGLKKAPTPPPFPEPTFVRKEFYV